MSEPSTLFVLKRLRMVNEQFVSGFHASPESVRGTPLTVSDADIPVLEATRCQSSSPGSTHYVPNLLYFSALPKDSDAGYRVSLRSIFA